MYPYMHVERNSLVERFRTIRTEVFFFVPINLFQIIIQPRSKEIWDSPVDF